MSYINKKHLVVFSILYAGILGSIGFSFFNSIAVSAASASITTSSSVTLNATSSGTGVSIDEESIGITTTCNNGYDLSIATTAPADLFLNGDSTNEAAFTSVDGTSALNSNNNTNKWGYTTVADATDLTVFSPLSTNVASLKTISETTGITNETLSIYYGAKTDSSVAPGSYSMSNNGVITYYLTMNPLCDQANIVYDGNGADAGNTMTVAYSDKKDGDVINLAASNFKRSGYGYAGWSFDKDAGAKLIDEDSTNNPIVYGPNETITLPNGFIENDTDYDGVIKLYAVWLPSQGNLQEWTGCENLDPATFDKTTGEIDTSKNSVTALTDLRDNNTYAVARLADGNCWMVENLRLNNNAEHNSDGILAQGHGGQYVGLANPENPWGREDAKANSIYSTDGTTTVTIPTPYQYYRIPRFNNSNTAQTTNMSESTTAASSYSYGNYYTWAAAAADTTYYVSTHDEAITDTSICPKGWYLPYGNTKADDTHGGKTNGGYYYLNHKINNDVDLTSATASKKFRSFPNNFVYSGYIDNSIIADRSVVGLYWTSTSSSISNSDRMYFTEDAVRPGSLSSQKYFGAAIRCIVDNNYTVEFNTNGGSEQFVSQRIQVGTPTELNSAEFLAAPTGASYTDADNKTINGDADKLWTFWGWNTAADGSGDWYKDKEVVTDLAAIGGSITLYAQWKQATLADMVAGTPTGTGKVIDHNLMQDMSAKICYNSTAHSMDTNSPANTPYDATNNTGGYHTATLLDYRGKTTAESAETYAVAKLDDDNCWMTNDLRLGSTEKTITLTSKDTDIKHDFTLPIVETSATKTKWGENNSTTGLNVAHAYKFNSTKNLYNWYTATAGTTYTSASTTTSICPYNWSLINKDQTSGYVSAVGETANSTNVSVLTDPPLSLTNGYYNSTNSTAYTNKSYWVANGWQNSSTGVYFGYFFGVAVSSNVEYIRTTYGYQKMMGLGIRCIADAGRVSIHYDPNDTFEQPAFGGAADRKNAIVSEITIQPANSYTREGFAFTGWNTAADGSGISVAGGAPATDLGLKPGESVTLYAQWSPQYTITYVDNCKTWAASDANCTTTKSNTISEQKITLNASGGGSGTLGAYNKFTLDGWKIKEWTTNADGSGTAYSVNTTYIVPNNTTPGSGITLYAHWAPVYTIQYDGNGSDNDANGMGTINTTTGIKTVAHTYASEGDQFDLFASNFKKAGHGFVGWSTDKDAWNKLTDNDNTNDAIIYGPNETYTVPDLSASPITTLYAVWAPAETINDAPVYFQNWTGCDAMTATTYDSATGKLTVSKNSITALTDQRDGNVYAVAKLTDNNCWMIENLRLDNSVELSTTNTNISASNSSLPITNVYGGATSNHLSASSDSWCYATTDECNEQSLINTSNITSNTTPSHTQIVSSGVSYSNFNVPIYSYGNYYNWYSATAGYGDHTATTSKPTEGDICPAGWSLPYGGAGVSDTNVGNTKGGLYYLANRIGAAEPGSPLNNTRKMRSFPINYIFSGFWSSKSASSRGSSGNYWTSSAAGSNGTTYIVSINHYNGLPGNTGSNNRHQGHAVRCVTQDSSVPVSSVNYEPNAVDVTDTMGYQFISSIDNKITLWASNFQRPGYGFAGWNTRADGSGASYGPNETIEITAGQYNNDILTLYAMWVPSAGDLQTWTGCPTLASGAVTALTDQRDNNTYAVAKLADGNCWMIENLRLDNTAALSSANTNNPASGFTSLHSPVSPYSSAWCNVYTEACVNQELFSNDNTANPTRMMTSADSNVYSYGNYYNWRTATADHGTSDIYSGNTSGDICPAGWRLPRGGNKNEEANNEYWSLIVENINNGIKPANYNGSSLNPFYSGNAEAEPVSNKIRMYPNNFIYSGYVSNDSISERGGAGMLLTQTASNSAFGTYKLNMRTNTMAIYPAATSFNRFGGSAVRCIKNN